VVAVGLADWAEPLTAAGCTVALSRPLGEDALLEAAAKALDGPQPAPARNRGPHG